MKNKRIVVNATKHNMRALRCRRVLSDILGGIAALFGLFLMVYFVWMQHVFYMYDLIPISIGIVGMIVFGILSYKFDDSGKIIIRRRRK